MEVVTVGFMVHGVVFLGPRIFLFLRAHEARRGQESLLQFVPTESARPADEAVIERLASSMFAEAVRRFFAVILFHVF